MAIDTLVNNFKESIGKFTKLHYVKIYNSLKNKCYEGISLSELKEDRNNLNCVVDLLPRRLQSVAGDYVQELDKIIIRYAKHK